MDSIDEIEVFGIRAKGKAERIRYLEGETLTRAEAMLAFCYDCTGGYADGARDCEIPACSLYVYMPYRKDKKKVKKARSEKQMDHDRKLVFLRSASHSSMKKKSPMSV